MSLPLSSLLNSVLPVRRALTGGPVSFWLFLFSLPFGFRVLLYQFTAGFDEYETVFLYLSDFFLLFFLLAASTAAFYRRLDFSLSSFLPKFPLFFLSAFLFFAALSVLVADYKFLALYNFIRLAFLASAALAIAALIRSGALNFRRVLAVLALLAVLESLIGLGQFLIQEDLGLKFLGESELGTLVGGAAKINVGGGKLLRAYGTFPHPNVLAAFLLLGFFGLFYFWLKRPAHPFLWNGRRYLFNEILLGAGIFVVVLGLLLTFSRAAWAGGILLSLSVIGYCLTIKEFRNQAVRLFILLLVIFYSLFFTLGFAVFPRAQISAEEPAVAYRLNYAELAIAVIKNNPLGVGLGNQVVYAVKNGLYEELGMTKPWQWQPIHNIYLLMTAEIGILGLASFLWFVLLLLFSEFKTQNSKLKTTSRNLKLEGTIIALMLISLLILGMFDHFLWTLWPGKLMFWLVVGIMMGVRPRS